MWSGHLTKWDGRPPCDVATPSDAIPIPNLLEAPMHPFLRAVARAATLGALALTLSFAVAAQQPITLPGAVQFDDTHPFNTSLLKFAELVTKYYAKPINFPLLRT